MTSHTLWSCRTDHCALLIFLKLKQLSLSPHVTPIVYVSFIFDFILSILPVLFLILPSPPSPCDQLPHFLSHPPAGVWLVKSGGCWGSSQSCKWGPPPGWPRHSVVQVRKPATLPTEQRWEREGLCVEWYLLPHWREKQVCDYSDNIHDWWNLLLCIFTISTYWPVILLHLFTCHVYIWPFLMFGWTPSNLQHRTRQSFKDSFSFRWCEYNWHCLPVHGLCSTLHAIWFDFFWVHPSIFQDVKLKRVLEFWHC